MFMQELNRRTLYICKHYTHKWNRRKLYMKKVNERNLLPKKNTWWQANTGENVVSSLGFHIGLISYLHYIFPLKKLFPIFLGNLYTRYLSFFFWLLLSFLCVSKSSSSTSFSISIWVSLSDDVHVSAGEHWMHQDVHCACVGLYLTFSGTLCRIS